MADWFTVAADRLHAVPDDLDDQTAALIEPLSTPVHAVRLAGDAFGTGLAGVRGRAVAVLGAGTIGLLVLAVLTAHGARRVVVTDMMAAKRDKALELGADAAVDAAAPTPPSRSAQRSARAPTSSSTASPSSPPCDKPSPSPTRAAPS